MKNSPRSIWILGILFSYIILQFLWWEVLLVKQNGKIINEKQKLLELSSTNAQQLRQDIAELHHRKNMQTVMIVGEGTVFLLLLLFGIYKIKQAHDKELLLNKQQNNFFLSITHELKTPIAATKLQLQTLQKQKLSEEQQQELIHNALLETERLNMLIDNVLLVSRLDTGEFIFKREKTELGPFIQTLLKRYYKQELANGQLRAEVADGLYSEIDVHAFPSVITNLIDNALKYSPDTKEVVLRLHSAEQALLISVSDLGCGIGEEDKQRVFERFFRAGNEETRSSKGTGLGLYIVQYIVKQHQGEIKIRNNSPKGSIFEITLHAA